MENMIFMFLEEDGRLKGQYIFQGYLRLAVILCLSAIYVIRFQYEAKLDMLI